MANIHTLDLNFQGRTNAIASYLIVDSDAVVLIESGPGSCLPALEAGLRSHNLTLADVTHVLLTHIHLDHAGAAGALAQHGAQIYVHGLGAPHLIHPEKLIASATRIYAERMDSLWGAFLPVPPDQLHVVKDASEIQIGRLNFLALATPGHAEHHHVYIHEDICFSGDVGGVRIPGYQYLRLPMPPPELHFGRWRESLTRLRAQKISRIAPTHFGIYDDPAWHLTELARALDAVERWLESVMPANPTIEELREKFGPWVEADARKQGLSAEALQSFALANPLGMSADGLMRYWQKVRGGGIIGLI